MEGSLPPNAPGVHRAATFRPAVRDGLRYTDALLGDTFILVNESCAKSLDNDAFAAAVGNPSQSAATVAERLAEAAAGANGGE